MKKVSLFLLLLTILISGCSSVPPEEVTYMEDGSDETGDVVIDNVESKNPSIIYSGSMNKPSISEMDNIDAITDGYVKDWENEHTITEKDLKYVDKECSEIVIKGGGKHTHYENEFKKSKITEGNVVTLRGTYNFNDSKLQLTDEEKTTLSERGWNIVPADRYEKFYKLDYSEDSAENEAYVGSEEWVRLYEKIGGSEIIYERYPANTILITNDLLLHSFHKLFDNTLKYYEQTIARDIIKDLSNDMFVKFAKLAKTESDPELKEIYDFLTAYWSVPAILLIDGDKFNANSGDHRFLYGPSKATNSDEKIKEIIVNNEHKYLTRLPSKYSELIPKIIEEILSANKLEEKDPFLHSFSPRYVEDNSIMQDYTQFKPRSHYTDNAELKTYFMAMKWLMREKFYFGDDKLVNATLVMVDNITDEDIQRLGGLSDKIKKLIGGDDDLTLESLSEWMKKNNISGFEKIKKLTKEKKSELFSLVPQKIQSSAYKINGKELSENEVKVMTDGFVFFGEKFTLDSYLFDLVTAGKDSPESEIKPNKQTALIVPDIIGGSSDAYQIVNLWLKEGTSNGRILEDASHTQYSSYDDVKKKAKENINHELETTTVMESTYHKWLAMVGDLIDEVEEDAPYFKLDPLYKLKNLVTYMGSYTELKHDTLLYVKQAYADFSNSAIGPFGLGKNCDINVDPPALPSPKGYIEADIDIIDDLIELNDEVKGHFGEIGERIESQFSGFNEFLNRTKNILEKQINNEEISEEDFEWMRLAYDGLGYIVYPVSKKEASQKEMRAALIADIFTSENNGSVDPLYEAVGRPALMLVMIDDINGKRVAIGPVFTHYEFYDSDNVIKGDGSRLNDLQWQANYDSLTGDNLKSALSILSRTLYEGLKSK